MREMLKRFRDDRSGATAIEYGIIIVVLSLTIIAGINHAGNEVQNMWVRIANMFESSVN
jgi:pilus assembly protein Flp/PilA